MNKKLDRLEERYVVEEITKEMFDKYQAKYKLEKDQINEQIGKMGKKASNLELYIDTAINFASKLNTVWHSSNYIDKQKVQFLAFPNGIYYDRKNDKCRTPEINRVFGCIADLTRVSEEKEKGNYKNNLQFPCSVARTGIEPVTFGL